MQEWVKSQLRSKKQLRYLISGGIGFASEYILFTLIYLLSHALVFSNSVSFIAALLITFFLHRKWSFASSYKLNTRNQFVRYASLAIINFFLINILIVFLTHYLHISAFLAKLITMIIIVTWNYLFLNNFIFHHYKSN